MGTGLCRSGQALMVTLEYQHPSYHAFTAGELLLLNTYSVGLCYSQSRTDTAFKPFLVQACGGDTPGPGVREGVRAQSGLAGREGRTQRLI
ncbi:hypothetical protein CgunFtcFv8_000238 [Champsocephalus gunnari]|uniref:Uncharacterized protein n=1 Tax=Champsocephalus gunnari TaxID=52237 RepID=A0AAN8DNG7_CHAGU|nr:hypothetical protein CgunFtcFv8_000238 [Champsocephalus gunnari]